MSNRLTLKVAKAEGGSVTDGNTKMPGSSFATDAKACITGSKLAKVKGSVCNGCYALRLQRFRKNVDIAYERNQKLAVDMIATDPDKWATLIAFQIERMGYAEHRWFDAGDLQSLDMLLAIVKVAELTPQVAHWLPTREYSICADFVKAGHKLPDNLTVRLSAPMVGDAPVISAAMYAAGFRSSTVHKKGGIPYGYACPATTEKHRALRADKAPNCGSCRKCWNRDQVNVSYPYH